MPDAYVTDAHVAALHDVARDNWAERVSRAGARLCRWLKRQGAPYSFACPVPAAGEVQ